MVERWVNCWQRDAFMTLHTLPVDDLIEHGASDCICGPKVIPVPREDGVMGWQVVHQSLDGREKQEKKEE